MVLLSFSWKHILTMLFSMLLGPQWVPAHPIQCFIHWLCARYKLFFFYDYDYNYDYIKTLTWKFFPQLLRCVTFQRIQISNWNTVLVKGHALRNLTVAWKRVILYYRDKAQRMESKYEVRWRMMMHACRRQNVRIQCVKNCEYRFFYSSYRRLNRRQLSVYLRHGL